MHQADEQIESYCAKIWTFFYIFQMTSTIDCPRNDDIDQNSNEVSDANDTVEEQVSVRL